ncbi:cytidine monophosphate-N-acetylneuraminic acid hydroxylase-like isoform X2 [Halichoerus grypus]
MTAFEMPPPPEKKRAASSRVMAFFVIFKKPWPVPKPTKIRSRVDVIRHMVKNGLCWDDLYIGFQTWLQQDPDIYHHLLCPAPCGFGGLVG